MLVGWGSLLTSVCWVESAAWTDGGARGPGPLGRVAGSAVAPLGLGDLRIFRDRYSIPAGEKGEGQSPSAVISGSG